MFIDLHVHTTRYSACSHLSPEEMATAALAAHLDAVVITEHNNIWNAAELAELQQQFPTLTILRAFEVSAEDKHDVLVYGIDSFDSFYKGMPVRDVVDTAHQLGGFTILAHPYRYHDTLGPEILETPFDACETRSVNIDPVHYDLCTQLAHQLGLPEVHNSDGHNDISIGGYCNEFHVPIHSEAELVEALRQQAYTPTERPDLVEAAIVFRAGRVARRIQQCIDRGITDPEAIRAKVGGPIERVIEVLEQLKVGV